MAGIVIGLEASTFTSEIGILEAGEKMVGAAGTSGRSIRYLKNAVRASPVADCTLIPATLDGGLCI